MEYIKQDISAVTRGIIAHGCNYFGVMGAGVAKILKDKYPLCFVEYAEWLQRFPKRNQTLGMCNLVNVDIDLYVANCITQGLESYDGQLATPRAIRNSLSEAYAHAFELKLPMYLPKIGAGLGGLNWEKDVEPIILELADAYDDVDTYVCIYP